MTACSSRTPTTARATGRCPCTTSPSDGGLTAISGSPFADNQTAPCWVALSPDGSALFAINTGVSSDLALRGRGRRDADPGRVDRHVQPDRPPAVRRVGLARRRRSSTSSTPASAKVSVFAVDGTGLTELTGSPVAIPGGAAPFGMVVD